MTLSKLGTFSLLLAAGLSVSACGVTNRLFGSVTAGGDGPAGTSQMDEAEARTPSGMGNATGQERSSIWELFGPNQADQSVNVNKYLWNASLDVLGFLPIETVDPFTGVIVTGYGTPPGGGRAYRATIHITDPALEARSLRLSLQTRNGPVSASTARAVEDAIMARARQMRISDNKF
jgi:hypothetical protein